MKAKIISLSVLMTIFLMSFANTTIPPMQEVLKKEICYPEFAKENKEEGIVLVHFTVDTNGKIVVNEANSNNERLKEYVISKLTQFIFSESNEKEEYAIQFKFRLF